MLTTHRTLSKSRKALLTTLFFVHMLCYCAQDRLERTRERSDETWRLTSRLWGQEESSVWGSLSVVVGSFVGFMTCSVGIRKAGFGKQATTSIFKVLCWGSHFLEFRHAGSFLEASFLQCSG